MRKDRLAKLLLSRLTSEERATAIVGDLLEVSPSPWQFCSAVVITAAAFCRRAVVGVVGAVAAEILIRFAYAATWDRMDSIHGTAEFCVVCMMPLTLVAAYSAVRRGLADPVTKASAALWLPASFGVFLRQTAWVSPISATVVVLLSLVFLCTAISRKALLSTVSGGAAAFGTMFASFWFAHLFYHRFVGVFVLGHLLMSAISIAATLSWFPPAPDKLPQSVPE